MLATLVAELPAGREWEYEIKFDGFRAIASVVPDGGVTLVSRNGLDLTQRFPKVAESLQAAVRRRAFVDGEVCALDDKGRTSFSAMQRAAPGTPIVYYLFDLLELDESPLIDRALAERRRLLEELLRRDEIVRFSASFADGEKLLRRVRSEGLEGVVAKRLESPYRPGKRTRDWLKIKARQRQEFVIAGYVRGRGRRERLGALVLAVYENGRLVHVGNCGTGFTEAEIDDLLHRLRPLVRQTPPFDDVPKMPRVRRDDVVWVEPELVCEVEFAEWTHDGHLRAPSYLGLREDKPAREVVRETPA